MYLYFETHYDYRPDKKLHLDNLKLLKDCDKHTNSNGIWGYTIDNGSYLVHQEWVDIEKYEENKQYNVNHDSEKKYDKILSIYYYRLLKINKLIKQK